MQAADSHAELANALQDLPASLLEGPAGWAWYMTVISMPL